MQGLVDVQAEFLLGFDCRCEGAFVLLELVCGFLGSEFVVDNLEDAAGFDGAVGGGAVRAIDDLAGHGVYGFGEGLALHVFEVWATEFLEEGATIGFVEEDMGAGLDFGS